MATETGDQETSISKTVLPNHAKFIKMRVIHSTCSSNLQPELYVSHTVTSLCYLLQERHFPISLRQAEKQQLH